MELLVIGGIIFVAYTLTQANRAKLALSQTVPAMQNVFLQNTSGRPSLVPGEPNSLSPFQWSQMVKDQPSIPAGIPIPTIDYPATGAIMFAPRPSSGLPSSGSTSFTILQDQLGHDAPLANPSSYLNG